VCNRQCASVTVSCAADSVQVSVRVQVSLCVSTCASVTVCQYVSLKRAHSTALKMDAASCFALELITNWYVVVNRNFQGTDITNWQTNGENFHKA
jgi:hypothetical protein